MKSNFKILILTAVLLTALTACRREKSPDSSSPAFQIMESEKITMPSAIDLPLNAPAGNARVATFYAEGVQKYKAQAKAGSAGTFEWVFIAPQANLYDISNAKIGTHGAGPYWQLTGSVTDSIFGQPYTPAKAISLDANSIDWLLLMPKAGKIPTGVFANVSYIQRILTSGGKAPATAPLSAAETIEVPYTAIYRFSKKL